MLQLVTEQDIPQFQVHNRDRFYMIGRAFGRYIYCRISDNIVIQGRLHYDIDTEKQSITISVKLFKGKELSSLILKQYKYAPDTNVRLLISSIRRDYLRNMPQAPNCKWSFFIEELF